MKRNKRSSKSKTNNSSKHEASTSGPAAGTDVELTQKQNQSQHNKSNNTNTNNNENTTVSVAIQKAENLNKIKEHKVTVITKPTSVEKPKTPVTAMDTPDEILSKQNGTTKIAVQKDFSSFLPTPEKQTFEKITSPVEVTPEPPSNDIKKSVIAMGRLLEPRSTAQPIGKIFRISIQALNCCIINTAATVPNNPWPKYIREIQRCLNSLDRLNDELNMVRILSTISHGLVESITCNIYMVYLA